MKATRKRVVVALVTALGWFGLARAQSKDPCSTRGSNREMRECYTAEQVRANARVDVLVDEIISSLRNEAKDSSNGTVAGDLLRKAESAVIESHKTWKNYRDQHCRAVELSWTTGSGAGTAYEACMFDLARQRIQDLRKDFGAWTKPNGRQERK
jgi:uncharacterized protein YecT (DUF1311 family)